MRTNIKYFLLILSLILLCSSTIPYSSLIQNRDTCQNPSQINKIVYQNDNPSKAYQESFLEKSIPWFIALAIGILTTVTNILVSSKLNKVNSKNVSEQLKTSKEIALTQFKSTIHSQNMQKWSDDLRESLSEFLSISVYIRAKMSDTRKQTDDEIFDSIIDDFKTLNKYKVKLLTLLNVNNPDEKVIAEKIVQLMKKGFVSKAEFTATEHIQLENALLADSRTLFQKHWEKIKDLEH